MYYQTDIDKAITYLDSAIVVSKKLNDKLYPAVAFTEKALLQLEKNQLKEAVSNYNKAEKYALKNNIDYYYVIRTNVAITKSENLGEVEEAFGIYKQCYAYYKTKDFRKPEYSDYYQTILFALADVYKSLNKIDSCTYYNRLGYKEANATKNENFKFMFALNEGANQINNKNYKVAQDCIKIALPKMIQYKNTGNVLASYYYLGKVNEGLKNEIGAIKNYLKVDSVYTFRKKINPEFISGYSFLIDYYKKKGDTKNQLNYIAKLMRIDSTLNLKYKKLDKFFQKDYDIPHLMVEKESLIKSLKNKNTVSLIGIGFFGFIIAGLIWYLTKQQKQQKINQLRFEGIILQLNFEKNKLESNTSFNINENNEIKKISTSKTSEIAPELVNEILEQLIKFENNKQFLESNITAQLLANQFKTNIKYLSKIVNEYKNKPFIQYVNDLRIDYALKELQNDKRLRNYTLSALANEFGFNSTESFNSSFYKKTKIKAIFYIKELENLKNN